MTNPYAPPRAAVRDIRDSVGATEPADRGTRLGAAILDSLIFCAMVYLPLLISGLISNGGRRGADAGMIFVVGILLMLVGFIAWCWMTVVYVKRNGQSIGKKIMEIKVIRADGSDVSLGRLFWLRNFVNGVISIIPLYGLIEVLFIFGESRQCLHDKLADTIVVKA
jgi:uncharacterized RDD family membrane protein YckC